MNREELKAKLKLALMVGPLSAIEERIDMLVEEICVDQQKMIDNMAEQIAVLMDSILREHGL